MILLYYSSFKSFNYITNFSTSRNEIS